MRAFPRNISFVLRTIWDNDVAEFADDTEEADFDVLIKHFIAAHCTPDDCHDLLSQLDGSSSIDQSNVNGEVFDQKKPSEEAWRSWRLFWRRVSRGGGF